jgi:Pyridoxamine 5'-phosphate oxidase
MGKVLGQINDAVAEFVAAQHVFFVSTAPTSTDGLVNVSPKGLDGSFAVLGPHEVAYLDLTGSGAETIAHLRDNGRICLMFCAFDGPPRIVRFHGRGEVIAPDDDRFADLAARFGDYPGTRSIIRVDVTRVSDSCGFAVPRMSFEADRDQLVRWAENRGDEGIATYQATRNAVSIDGLPALSPPPDR